MATYEEAGVNIHLGDECSKIAYNAAKETFSARAGMIGQPVVMEGGFAGAMDFGEFYLVQNDDGIGTKMVIARKMGKYDTMGQDLLAMVADDAICVGAEVVSISNTIDIEKVNRDVISQLVEGLKNACIEQKIVIPGGEIAELGEMVNGYIWNATAIGIVEKEKIITGENIQVGDKLIGLASDMLRSNGFTLVRHVLKKAFGEEWYNEPYGDGRTWGEVVLTPTLIYHNAVLEMLGRYKKPAKVEIKALAHITGGGLPGNVCRIFKGKNMGADLGNLPEVPAPFKKLQELGNVSDEEAFKTWNMGIGLVMVSNEFEKIREIAEKHGIKAYEIGEVVAKEGVKIGKMQF
jgi:phosphoribosylformylglycinamidine cyclo-ligase